MKGLNPALKSPPFLLAARTGIPFSLGKPVLDRISLSPVASVHGLGELLLVEVPVVAVARSRYHQRQTACQLHSFLDKKDLASVTHAPVTSWLNSCKVFYVGLPLKMLQKL